MLLSQNHSACELPDENLNSQNNIIPAMSTPLASIFGSGFLVVVPILASAVGPYAVLAMIVVALVAFQVGYIVRHNIHFVVTIANVSVLFLSGSSLASF
jgi:hypothetical protein